MFDTPQPQTRAERQAVVDRIVHALLHDAQHEVIAIGQYGSMARDDDQPYSDIELFCIVDGVAVDHSHEWVYGQSKAEVNLYSQDMVRAYAQAVDEHWALSQGQFLDARPLYGNPAYFEELRQLVLSPPPAVFHEVIAAMIVGELYEWMGKARNARQTKQVTSLPTLACQFVEHTALILGLQQRRCYTTGATMLAESLQRQAYPAGYERLCKMVMHGKLDSPSTILQALDALWQGIGVWVITQEIDLSAHSQWPFTPPMTE
ncbi:MAG: hypothetical protein KF832_27025 [Caldilineaceae bacterium]|nr:hypothetical protein [Caldilineaceae bacterium]